MGDDCPPELTHRLLDQALGVGNIGLERRALEQLVETTWRLGRMTARAELAEVTEALAEKSGPVKRLLGLPG
jgi:hypothetical protein